MRTLSQVFAGAGSWHLGLPGKYFRIMENTTAVNVNLYRGGRVVYDAYNVTAGFWAKPEGGFDRVEIISAGAQTVSIGISNGDGGFNGATATIAGVVTVNFVSPQHVIVDNLVSSTLTEGGAVVTGAVAVQIAAADATRAGLRVYNDGLVDVYLGSAAVTLANGVIKIPAGGLWVETEAARAAWFAISAVAGSVRTLALT